VRGDGQPVVMRGIDDRAQLLVVELRRLPALGDAEHAARDRDLDEVRAFLVVLAHRTHRFGRTVDHVVFDARTRDQVRAPAVGEIAVTAGAGDDATGSEDARPDDLAGIDGVAQAEGDVEEKVAAIPHGGEARLERAVRVYDAVEGVVRR